MVEESIIDKRLHSLEMAIRKAQTIMPLVHLGNRAKLKTRKKYMRLIRIQANAEGVLNNTFRKTNRLHLCSQAVKDLDSIKTFIEDHKSIENLEDSVSRKGEDYQARFGKDVDAQKRRKATLRSSKQSIHVDDPQYTPLQLNTEPHEKFEAARSPQTSTSKEKTEVLGLTVDSDEEVPALNDNVQFSTSHQEASKEPVSPAQEQIDWLVWQEYETRRHIVLWYRPEKDIDEDMCP